MDPIENLEQEHLLVASNENHQPHLELEGDPNANGGDGLIRSAWEESKKLWKIGGPSIFSRISLFSMTVITQSFAGHLGNLDLAAISIVTTVIISITFGFLLGMASALETLCGQAYGAGKYHMLGVYMQRSWIVLFFCSILLLPLFIFAAPILNFIGEPSDVAEQTGIVAIWLIPMHISFAFQFPLQRFLQSQLKTGAIAVVSGVALLVHVFISWLFVYKMKVGIVGTVLTLDFSWWVSVFGLFGYSVCGGCRLSWIGFSAQAFVGLWEFFKLSIASGIMLALESFYFRVLILVAGYMQNAEVALDALSICITLYVWESMIQLGLFAAAGVRVANELGAGDGRRAKFATIISVLTSIILGLFFWSIVMIFSNELAQIFTSSSSVITYVNELAVLLAFTILLNSIQPILSGVAVGCGWQSLVAFVNLGCYYIVGLPLGILLGWLLQFGIKGLWAGMIGGTVVQTLILIIFTVRFQWDKEAEIAHLNVAKR
ncbi:Multi antimicrobial extrusion protein [Dillenia turbinata]|uniref:Protein DETOXIFICATION n=1 Tax=Dillenia turbinata TaxID=194707 RepID=A0AAN8VYH8_9MAGN